VETQIIKFCEYCSEKLSEAQIKRGTRFHSRSCVISYVNKKTKTGITLTDEHKRKDSESVKKALFLIKDKISGKNNAMYGKKHSEETKQKMREKRKLQVYSEESKKKMSESAIKRMRNGKINFKISSKLEDNLLNKLENIFNVKIERQFCLNDKYYDGKYNNTLIECDGEYWHSRAGVKIVDELKEQIAAKNNFTLYRILLDSRDIDEIINKNKALLNKIFKKEINE